jgi:drug/metabolite transporter (DMT)-like permease
VTALGVVIISPDSLIIRLVDADSWSILTWRAPATAIGLAALLAIRYRERTLHVLTRIGPAGMAVAVTSAIGNILFVVAINNTAVSNVLVILAGAPVVAGLLSWMALRENVASHTWIATALVATGVAILVRPGRSSGLEGDLAATGGMLLMATTLTITRHARTIDMTAALFWAQLLITITAVVGADVARLPTSDMVTLAVSGLLLLPISSALFIAGPRHMPAAEVGLLLPLETVLASTLVWLVVGEQPTPATVAGGVIVIAALVWHSITSLRVGRSAARSRGRQPASDQKGDT